MTRTILVEGTKTFRIDVPDDARMTFGPFSPPAKGQEYGRGYEERKGTLRIYRGTKGSTTENILGVFSGVTSFRDMGEIVYMEKVAVNEVSTMWKSDEKGYVEERKENGTTKWVTPDERPQLDTTSEETDNVF